MPDTMLLQHTAATTRRRIPVTMDHRPTAVSTVLVASWLPYQVAAAVQHQFMRQAMDPMALAAAPIPAAIRVDHLDVRRDRVLVLNLLAR